MEYFLPTDYMTTAMMLWSVFIDVLFKSGLTRRVSVSSILISGLPLMRSEDLILGYCLRQLKLFDCPHTDLPVITGIISV